MVHRPDDQSDSLRARSDRANYQSDSLRASAPHIEASKLVEPIGWYMLEFILSNHDIFNGFEIHFLDEKRSSILALKKVNLAADWYSACTRTLLHELS